MRHATAKKIDALHAKIAALIEEEKAHYEREHPEANALWKQIAHARIEMAAESPKHRALMYVATAALHPGALT